MKQLKLFGLSLLALGFTLACNKTADPVAPITTNSAGSGATTGGSSAGGSGGSSTGGSDNTLAGADGQDDQVRKGERGSSCDSNNDCADDLSCIVTHDCPVGVSCANKSCQPSNFALVGTGKRCYTHECASKDDCCGDMPQTAPKKCANRKSICSTPSVAGCTARTCTAATEQKDCGKGTCGAYCSYNSVECNDAADCLQNTCILATHSCSLTSADCTTTACATVTNTCTLSPHCVCKNPDYQPTSDICTDEDCDGICGFACKEERCVVDSRCESDADCAVTTPFCNDGTCGECATDDDCDEEKCVAGHCGPTCKTDTQCKVFEACQAGECVYVGCRSDRECVLQAGATAPTQDPRLSKCQIAKGKGTCVFPCEIDAQCATSEVCLEGVCKYIGCDTDQECKTIAGVHNLPVPTHERPWSTTVECRTDADAATP